VLPNADQLRAFVIAVTGDERAPASIRNACHRLMIAIERNDARLVEQSLFDLREIAAVEKYALPQL
jgi:hypothetical protein